MRRRRRERTRSVAGLLIAAALLAGCASLLDLAPIEYADPDGAVADQASATSDAAADTRRDDVVTDAAPEAGRSWRYVFVSSQKRDGTLAADGGPSGRASGDAWCKALADRGLPALRGRTWTTWLSLAAGPSHAMDRITDGGAIPVEYRLPNDVVVFPVRFGFDAAIPSNPIQLDENGANPAPRVVWSGTDSKGFVSSNTCSDWTSATTAFSGTIGTSTDRQGWTVNPTVTQTCDATAHVYCFEAL